MEIYLSDIADMDEFVRFIRFCVERLDQGKDTPEIWEEWEKEKEGAA